MPEAVIVATARTPIGRAFKGSLKDLRPDDLAAFVVIENHRSEFRTPEESVLLEYAALTGGRPHYIYPQHELVQRLREALTAAGGEVRFGHAVLAQTGRGRGGVVRELVTHFPSHRSHWQQPQ